MRLYVRMFYILLVVFAIGIVVVCIVENSSVLSRIGTGLITGSFVGLITAFSNYYHLRQTYFEKLVLLILDLIHSLSDDLRRAQSRNKYIATTPKADIIKHSSGTFVETQKLVEEMKSKYDGLASRVDFEAFTSLILFGEKQLIAVLEEMEDLVNLRLKFLYGFYSSCFDFSMLSVKASKKERELVLGNPDEFFDFVVQENIDFQDMVAYHLKTLAKESESLLLLSRRSLSKLYADMLRGIVEVTRSLYLKGVVIRDPLAENVEKNSK